MPESTRPTDHERMQAALELAANRESPTAESLLEVHRLAARRRMTIAAAAAAAVVIGGVVGWLIAASDHDLTRRSSVPGWQSAVGWTLWGVGFVGCTVLVVHMARSGWYRRQRERVRPFTVLTPNQQKLVVKQLRGRIPVVVAHLPLVRLMAENVVNGVPTLRLFGAIVVFLGGSAFRSGSVFQWSLFLALTAVAVVGALSHRPLLRRSRAVLANPPPPIVDGDL